jgi:RNA polymerase sigma-70 factor (ECF subfamily)
MDRKQLKASISAAQTGDAEGFRAILAAYGSRLYGYFYRTTRNHHDAEDLLGELSLKLVRRLGDYDDRGRFDQWLFRIAANMVRDRIRRAKAAPPAASLSAGSEDGKALGDSLPAAGRAVDAELLAREASAELSEALDQLDEKTRQMILLRHFGQMSFKELAEMFECPMGTALARVHRGLAKLRHLMTASPESTDRARKSVQP